MSELELQYSTSIVGRDIRMSNLDICVSKVILEFGKNKTAKNSRLNVAFRIFFQILIDQLVKELDVYSKKHAQVGHTFVQVLHTYVQAENISWTYVCPTPVISLDIHTTPRLDIRMSNP